MFWAVLALSLVAGAALSQQFAKSVAREFLIFLAFVIVFGITDYMQYQTPLKAEQELFNNISIWTIMAYPLYLLGRAVIWAINKLNE